ncbi:MAG: DMT family transporter [Bacteroidota bacterium]
MFHKFRYHILMHLIIFVWGFTGILGKLIHLDALNLVWHRILVALVSLLIGLSVLKMPMRIKSTKHLLFALLVGVFVAVHWITFYVSIQLSTASLGILCLSTATLHVTWLEPLVMKRRFSWIEFLLGLFVIYGIYFVSSNFSAQDYEALAYGLVSALTAACFNVFNAKLVQSVPSSAITLYEIIMALAVLTGVLAFEGKLSADLFVMTLSDFLWLLFLGILCTSVAFLLTIDIIKKLGTFTVSLSINLEPVYTMLLAIVILHEHELLGVQFYIGSSIIILVVVANAVIKHYLKPAAKNTRSNSST